LFDDKATIVYPREKMLVPSNASYGRSYKIFTSALANENIETKRLLDTILKNSTTLACFVSGILSGEKATIEKITRVLSEGKVFLEIEVLEPTGSFLVGESVRIDIGEDFIFENIQTVFDCDIVDGGFDYREGDSVSISGTGIVGSAFVVSTTG